MFDNGKRFGVVHANEMNGNSCQEAAKKKNK